MDRYSVKNIPSKILVLVIPFSENITILAIVHTTPLLYQVC